MSYMLWDRVGTTNRGVLMNQNSEDETKDQQQECTDEYCETCGCGRGWDQIFGPQVDILSREPFGFNLGVAQNILS